MPFLVAAAVCATMVPLLRRSALSVGLVDRPGHLKIHQEPIPIVGGVAVAIGLIAGVATEARPPLQVMGAIVLTLVIGLADDIRPLSPVLRLVFLTISGGLLAVGGVHLDQFGLFGSAAIVLVMVACTNAVNLLDGQDGLAGGVALASVLGLTALGWDHEWSRTLGLAAAGSLAVFLWWNRPPARLFLGNNGAYALGAVLAALIASVASDGSWRTLLAAGTVVGVFAFEFLATVVRRLALRSELTGGDRDHSYDILSARRRRTPVTLAYCLVGVCLVGVGTVIAHAPIGASAAVAIILTAGASVWGYRLWRSDGRRPEVVTSICPPQERAMGKEGLT
jgi:UDP-GlcNAc:undecaprenyl-phosphate GlcNAc-1-phosphate transferase